MKKFARSIAVIVLVALLGSFAFAESLGVDLTALSFEELLTLRQEIDQLLLASDAYSEFTLAQGTFTVGTDFPEGTYTMTSPVLAAVGIFNGDPHDDANLEVMFTVTKKENIEKIELKDGQIVTISGSNVTVATYTGLDY